MTPISLHMLVQIETKGVIQENMHDIKGLPDRCTCLYKSVQQHTTAASSNPGFCKVPHISLHVLNKLTQTLHSRTPG